MAYIYKIFENKKSLKKDVENWTKEYIKDKSDKCSYGINFAIVGKQLALEFVDIFCVDKSDRVKNPIDNWGGGRLKNQSSNAEIVDIYFFELAYDGRTGDISYHFSTFRKYVKYKDVILTPYPISSGGSTFAFHILNDDANYNCIYSKELEDGLKRPNNVGTLTDTKIDDWYVYLTTKQKRARERYAERIGAVNQFLSKVRKQLKKWGMDESLAKDQSGRIVRNGLVYKYSISNDGCISQSVEVDFHSKTSFDAFVDISTNKYNDGNVQKGSYNYIKK